MGEKRKTEGVNSEGKEDESNKRNFPFTDEVLGSEGLFPPSDGIGGTQSSDIHRRFLEVNARFRTSVLELINKVHSTTELLKSLKKEGTFVVTEEEDAPLICRADEMMHAVIDLVTRCSPSITIPIPNYPPVDCGCPRGTILRRKDGVTCSGTPLEIACEMDGGIACGKGCGTADENVGSTRVTRKHQKIKKTAKRKKNNFRRRGE